MTRIGGTMRTVKEPAYEDLLAVADLADEVCEMIGKYLGRMYTRGGFDAAGFRPGGDPPSNRAGYADAVGVADGVRERLLGAGVREASRAAERGHHDHHRQQHAGRADRRGAHALPHVHPGALGPQAPNSKRQTTQASAVAVALVPARHGDAVPAGGAALAGDERDFQKEVSTAKRGRRGLAARDVFL